jgi:hypothetical protein
MTAPTTTGPAPGVAGTTATGIPYPAVTGPKPYLVAVTDVAAIAAEGAEVGIETIVKLIGPAAPAAVALLGDVPKLLGLLLELRDPVNGKNLQRVAIAQGFFTQGGEAGIAGLIGRFNATPLEPDWDRQLCQCYAVMLGVPMAAFPS